MFKSTTMSDQWGSGLWRLALSWFTTAILCQTVQSGLIPAPSSELYVETTTGPVYGFYNDTGRTVRTFLGIPYAEPPTGDRRFAPPVNKAPWDTVLHASSYSGPCPGIYSFSNESIWSYLPYIPWNIPDMTEDCLTVNIWAPGERHPGNSKKNNNKEKAPVMMYIYGGGFNQGGTALTFYDGTNLVKDNENVVFVTFKYACSTIRWSLLVFFFFFGTRLLSTGSLMKLPGISLRIPQRAGDRYQ